MVNQTSGKDQYPSPPVPWHPGRAEGGYYPEEDRLEESSGVRRPPMTISKCLREICQVPGNIFFVAAEDNGEVRCFSTPVGSKQLDCTHFFSQEAFIKAVAQVKIANNHSFNTSELGFTTKLVSSSATKRGRTRVYDQCQYTDNVYTDEEILRPGKRIRNSSGQGQISMASNPSRKAIRIGDTDIVYAYYDHTLRRCQQLWCKSIGKTWVKAILPKKQSTNPYTKGDASRPDWWPKTYFKVGEYTPRKLRHKEPDHLIMGERVFLLCHILRMLVEPKETRHPTIQTVGLTLNKLEEVTYESLSTAFGSEDTPRNRNNKSLLAEMFKVARQEARFRNHEIDGDTEIFVTAIANNKTYKESASNLDDDDDDDDYDDDDDDANDIDNDFGRNFTPQSSGPSSVEPNGPLMMPQVQPNGHGESGHFSGNSFAENIPIHASHSHPGYNPDFYAGSSYIGGSSISHHAPSYSQGHPGLPEMYPTPQATSTRASGISSPSDYRSPATPVIYSHWPGSNPPSHPSTYGFQPQPPSAQAFGGQMTRDPSYVTSTVDGIPPPTADVHHGDIFPSGSVGPSTTSHEAAFAFVKTEGGHNPLIRESHGGQ